MKVNFLISAEWEFQESIDDYNKKKENLGFEFADEVERTVQRIIQFPKAWQKISRRTRRCLIDRFPFGILYQNREDSILIVAVMHLNKHPDSWKKRLPRNER